MNENFSDQEFLLAYRETVQQVMQLLPSDLSAIAKHNAGWTMTSLFQPMACSICRRCGRWKMQSPKSKAATVH